MIESIAGVIGGQLAIVQRVIRPATNDAAVALEQFEANAAGDARLNRRDERIDGFARRREPEAVVDGIGVDAPHVLLDPFEIARDHEFLELAMRGMQHDRRRRFVDLA